MPVPPIIFLAVIMCGSAVLITAMMLISRHISLRRMSSQVSSGDEIALRLERIEQTVEATAIEVERLAESSRFVTKLLADKTNALPR
jgi:chromosome segregation and condensation protein ScpB